MTATPKLRLTVLCLIPLIISCLLSSVAVYQHTTHTIEKQNTHFAKVFTSQLAMSSAQYLVNDDALGINVVLNRMHKDQLFDFASIYDVNNQLVAQAGSRLDNALITNHEITFQDSTAGYAQVGFNLASGSALANRLVTTIVLIHVLLASFFLTLIWLGADFVALWVLARPRVRSAPDIAEASIEVEPTTVELEAGALLVLKLVPARLTDQYRKLMLDAAAIYGGKVLRTDLDDIAIQFRHANAGYSAICAGLLIRTLVAELGKPLQCKLGLHWSEELERETEDPALKHASYLSSIAEQNLLSSKRFVSQLPATEPVERTEYRGSLAPDGEVFEILNVENQELLTRQAAQLLERR